MSILQGERWQNWSGSVQGTPRQIAMPGSLNELVQRIEELIDDPERAAQIGAEAKRYACAKFTRDDSDFRILKDLQRLRGRTDWRVALPKCVVASLSSIAVQADAQAGALKLAGESDAKDRRIVELQKEVEDRSAWAQRLDEEMALKNGRIVELQKEVKRYASKKPEEVKAAVGEIKDALQKQERIARYVGDSLTAQVEKAYVEMGGKPFLPISAALERVKQHALAHGKEPNR